MTKKNSFKYEELIDCANGKLFGPGNAKLPSPPMLMFDRITNIEDKNILVGNLPKAPNGKKIKSVEVLVKIV